MPPTPQQIELVRKYEPILYFHTDERFFPVDPKRYVEECALWRTRKPTRTKDDWGEEPPGVFPKSAMRASKTLAAMNSPSELLGDEWLGNLLPAEPNREDRFLALANWEDSTTVSESTENRHSDLAEIARQYQPTVSTGLALSRFWYYTEILDRAALAILIRLTPPERRSNLDLQQVLDHLDNPRLVLYHLFYPAHEEPLEGCQGFGDGSQFASYAGEWACVAVLEENGTPTRIGITQRNVGTLVDTDEERRIGMRVQPWGDTQHVEGRPDHAKVFVALGTHSNYLTTGTNGEHGVAPFTSDTFDLSRDSCGTIEAVDDAVSGVVDPGPGGPSAGAPVILMKILGPGLITGFLAFIGALFVLPEVLVAAFGAKFASDVAPERAPVDRTPSEGRFGHLIHPQGLSVPEDVASSVPWRTFAAAAPGGEFPTADGRRYPFIVDRATQVWWRSRPGSRGYDGRWGLATDHDPKGRRSGMRLPHFWLMFMTALARERQP